MVALMIMSEEINEKLDRIIKLLVIIVKILYYKDDYQDEIKNNLIKKIFEEYFGKLD